MTILNILELFYLSVKKIFLFISTSAILGISCAISELPLRRPESLPSPCLLPPVLRPFAILVDLDCAS